MTSPIAAFIASILLGASLPAFAQKPDFKPNRGPDLETVTVTSGDITLLLRQQSQWTPGRIDFKGNPMTTERSAYGTVFMFPEIGFIGTAHLENEPENLQSLQFQVDGKPIEPKTGIHLTNQTFSFVRTSQIRDFHLKNTVEIRDNRLFETAEVQTDQEVPLKLIYHFMHAWKPTVSAFLAASESETFSGELTDSPETSRKFFVNADVDWIAVFEPESNQFAVSRLLEKPEDVKHGSKIWNVPGTYRKYYLTAFQNAPVPAGFDGKWRMVTAFGTSSKADWESAARKLAESLKE